MDLGVVVVGGRCCFSRRGFVFLGCDCRRCFYHFLLRYELGCGLRFVLQLWLVVC